MCHNKLLAEKSNPRPAGTYEACSTKSLYCLFAHPSHYEQMSSYNENQDLTARAEGSRHWVI